MEQKTADYWFTKGDRVCPLTKQVEDKYNGGKLAADPGSELVGA